MLGTLAINANYKNEITSEQIEATLSCNFDYMNRVFKRLTGMTIFAYLTDLRMQKACELLTTTSLKVGAVAHMVGFSDETYFYKVFKKAFACFLLLKTITSGLYFSKSAFVFGRFFLLKRKIAL